MKSCDTSYALHYKFKHSAKLISWKTRS